MDLRVQRSTILLGKHRGGQIEKEQNVLYLGMHESIAPSLPNSSSCSSSSGNDEHVSCATVIDNAAAIYHDLHFERCHAHAIHLFSKGPRSGRVSDFYIA
jgi:hypothetical protein